MANLIGYSPNKEWAYYDDNTVAHRHKLNPANDLLGCEQCYYLVADGKCMECGKAEPEPKKIE